MRPLSGSGSLGLMVQLFEEYGPDSLIGSSAIMGSSRLPLCTHCIYRGGRYQRTGTASPQNISDLVGFAAAVFIVFTVFM